MASSPGRISVAAIPPRAISCGAVSIASAADASAALGAPEYEGDTRPETTIESRETRMRRAPILGTLAVARRER